MASLLARVPAVASTAVWPLADGPNQIGGARPCPTPTRGAPAL